MRMIWPQYSAHEKLKGLLLMGEFLTPMAVQRFFMDANKGKPKVGMADKDSPLLFDSVDAPICAGLTY
jgi:hypothetical protein